MLINHGLDCGRIVLLVSRDVYTSGTVADAAMAVVKLSGVAVGYGVKSPFKRSVDVMTGATNSESARRVSTRGSPATLMTGASVSRTMTVRVAVALLPHGSVME